MRFQNYALGSQGRLLWKFRGFPFEIDLDAIITADASCRPVHQADANRRRWSLFKRSTFGSTTDLLEKEAEGNLSLEDVR